MTSTPILPTECLDCGGPVRQAFSTTDAYVACRRCGHVFTTVSSPPVTLADARRFRFVHLQSRQGS